MNRDNVIRYPKQRRFNIGIVLFLFVAVYLIIQIAVWAFREKMRVFTITEVTSLAESDTFTGLILRTEEVTTADKTGYVNYYVESGQRVRVDELICSLDEEGSVSQQVLHGRMMLSWDEEDLSSVRESLIIQSKSSPDDFSSLYRLRRLLDGRIYRLMGKEADQFADTTENTGASFHRLKASSGGIVLWGVDGTENLVPEELTHDT